MSNSVEVAINPWLNEPLHGVRWIEASAGTGKTFTLATLVTRLVVERQLRIGQILAVTFTEAATQELRKRIRERLQLALELLDAPQDADESHERGLTRDVLRQHLQQGEESEDALRRRLRQAVMEIDLSAIFTIHGFCARVLREYALESGQGFDAPELLGNDRDLRNEVAADLWRWLAQDAGDAEDLSSLWKGGHEALAADLGALIGVDELLPPRLSLPPDPTAKLRAAGQALADGFNAHGKDFLAALLSAIEGKVLNGTSYKAGWVNTLWAEWSAWQAAGDYTQPLDSKRLLALTQVALQSKTNKSALDKTPQSPLSALIPPYLEALAAMEDYRQRRRAELLHRLRELARERITLLKSQRRLQTYDDLIEHVAAALDSEHGASLAAKLREQYQVALVDEFQDTDARQWAIFNRVFGAESGAPALFLIGDPKQAIYGFRGGDVHTYLAASALAEKAPELTDNFRSRPALLKAIAALYENAGETGFVDTRIRFIPVQPGGKCADSDFQRDGKAAPALTLWQAPAPTKVEKSGKIKPHSAGEARNWVTAACVASIHQVLSEARAGKASLKDKVGQRPVQPGDIAVLVRSHREATMIQQALALAGVPSVAAGKLSLFATNEAHDLHALLQALLHSGDDERLRAALATVLIGVDGAGIAALAEDGAAMQHWQQQALHWRERVMRRGGGLLAVVSELCAAHAPRLLALLDGERRLSNYLQLAELLQEAQRHSLGLPGLVDWLGQRIASADANDEAQLLRLESDARRVQIVTLHKSKGLEYPLVYLPFVGIGRSDGSPGTHCFAHEEDDGRRLHWNLSLPEAQWDTAKGSWVQEQRAEDARLLYVGLTRAQHALWIGTGEFFGFKQGACALWPMLQSQQILEATGVIDYDASVPPMQLPRLASETSAAVPPARVAHALPPTDWWVYSFSQLSKADAGTETNAASTEATSGGNDEPESSEATEPDNYDPRFAGNRYGVALHAALEDTDFAAWRDWRKHDVAPEGQADFIAAALSKEGYSAELIEDGVVLTTQLVGQTLTVALPEGVRLCDVPAEQRRPEIEFQFALRPTRIDALLALLHQHGVVRERHGFGLRARLEGLMTGLIDLTYTHNGRWYVLDYKSNRLPAYDAATLQRAMAHSEYDLQALIYTLALHRWLRFRLGNAYDYERDMGGIRYVFCRGLDADSDAGLGIHAQRFDPALVYALDELFGRPGAEGVAA